MKPQHIKQERMQQGQMKYEQMKSETKLEQFIRRFNVQQCYTVPADRHHNDGRDISFSENEQKYIPIISQKNLAILSIINL